MTNQEAFDTVWDWFVVQEKPKSKDGDICSYRDSSGNRCAVGVLIPDEMYRCYMEGSGGVDDLLKDFTNLKDYLQGVDIMLLKEMQSAHDSARPLMFTETIQRKLREIAEEYQLEVPND